MGFSETQFPALAVLGNSVEEGHKKRAGVYRSGSSICRREASIDSKGVSITGQTSIGFGASPDLLNRASSKYR
jgi:hypothetical protein